jgi:hypothetical protein
VRGGARRRGRAAAPPERARASALPLPHLPAQFAAPCGARGARTQTHAPPPPTPRRRALAPSPAAPAAGEFGRHGKPEDLVADAHLRRWLVARDWHVDVTYKLLVHHGGWRAHVLSKGYIPEVRGGLGGMGWGGGIQQRLTGG